MSGQSDVNTDATTPAKTDGKPLEKVRKMASEVSSREGCYLYDIELTGGGSGRILRVTIEKDAEGGVSVEDCTNVSRGLNELLDLDEEIIPGGNYFLEVSSPGLERPLKEQFHFDRVMGKKIFVRSFQALEQFNENLKAELGITKQVQGRLLSRDASGVKVELLVPSDTDEPRGVEVFVPTDMITKAHVVFEFEDPAEKKSLAKKGGKKPGQKAGAGKK